MKIDQTHLRLSGILFVGFVLCACISENAAGDPTHLAVATQQLPETGVTQNNPTLSSTPMVTASLTLPPTSTYTPGPSPTLAPTPAFGSGIVDDDFLFGNQPEGCELPCWQGLKVGVSGAEDVQAALDTAFGFNGSYDFLTSAKGSPIAGSLVTWYRWNFASASLGGPSPNEFGISLFLQEDSRQLEAIVSQGLSPRFNQYTNPQHILRELGKPSMMLTVMSGSENPREGSAGLTIVYERGIILNYLAIRVQYDTSGRGTLCLGPQPHTNYYWMEAYLTGPIPNDLNELSPLQDYLFGQLITTSEYYGPFEDVFGIDLEEITSMAQQAGDLCITTKVPVNP